MAELENFTEISENFDTIKTLLNSIRAQGILNTSDVDKLLSGINSKLEKINTEEDIDLIKIFLSELKQSLEERHSILVSKFSAIESLFTNLLKNSNEVLKANEAKELFDIVATNLSVFSREVVSQKETLTDISLRIEALRSDDSAEKNVIKNIALLKSDLERLNNGFDSIVISLNDNFKAIIKTITSIDKTEYLDKFSDSLSNIEMASETLLSAIQVLDKKTEQLDDALENLATKDDAASSLRKLDTLNAQTRDIITALSSLDTNSVKLDVLSDKIDGSVNIIAGLKSLLQETGEKSYGAILEQVNRIEADIKTINPEIRFEEFKSKIADLLNSISALQEANFQKITTDISKNTADVNAQINKMQSDIGIICENNFNSVQENISELRKLTSQIEENGIASNNAIYSSISDRLSLFETSLENTLTANEKAVAQSSVKLVDQVDNIKNLSDVLTYKVDSSIVEMGNAKRGLEELKKSIDGVLALGFAEKVKELRVDLYASKQELQNSLDTATSDVSEKLSSDLFSKYELVIKKLDLLEDNIKQTEADAFVELKTMLDKISNSIVDVLTYVSERKSVVPVENVGSVSKFEEILKDSNLNYVESVRDIVDVVRAQVESYLKQTEQTVIENLDIIKDSIEKNAADINVNITKAQDSILEDNSIIKGLLSNGTEDIKQDIKNSETFVSEKLDGALKSSNAYAEDLKKDIKYSYSKLLEIQDTYKELKELLNLNRVSSSDKLESVAAATTSIKEDFEEKLNSVRNDLEEKITEFQSTFTFKSSSNYDSLKEIIKSSNEKSENDISIFADEIKELISKLSTDDVNVRTAALAKILDNFVSLKELSSSLNAEAKDNLNSQVEILEKDLNSLSSLILKVDENIDSDMTKLMSIVENNFESVILRITDLSETSESSISDKINTEFENVAEKIDGLISTRLEDYKGTIEKTFDSLSSKALEQSKYLQERIVGFNELFKSSLSDQAESNIEQLNNIANDLKLILDEKTNLSQEEYNSLKNQLTQFASNITGENQKLIDDIKVQLDEITKYIDSILSIQAQEATAKNEFLLGKIGDLSTEILAKHSEINDFVEKLNENISETQNTLIEASSSNFDSLTASINAISSQVNAEKQVIESVKGFIVNSLSKECETISANVEREIKLISDSLVMHFEQERNAQEEDLVALTTKIEGIINSHISSNVSELKSYLDVKTDSTELNKKLDKLELDLEASVKDLVSNLNRMLDANVFQTSLSDYKLANEVFVNSALTSMNEKVEAFIEDNIKGNLSIISSDTKKLQEKLAIFDKNLKDTIVDKYEEIKLLSNSTKDAFDEIKTSVNDILSTMVLTNKDIDSKLDEIVELINISSNSSKGEIKTLSDRLEVLKSQISTKTSDERFQALMNSQIDELRTLITEQLGYIEDINDLCCTNLPDITELNGLVKDSILESIKNFSTKMESQIDSIADVSSKMTSQIGTMADVSGKLTTQLSTIADVSQKINEQFDSISNVSVKLDEQATILKDLNTDSNNQNVVLDDISGKLDLHEDSINDVRNVLDDLDGSLNNITTSLDSQNNRISSLFDNIEAQGGDIESLTTTIENDFKQLKSEVINHILDVFNQISFVAEQEEILDFIQEKHNELITVLSHIVTNTDDITYVREDVEFIRDEIDNINKKISSIISAEGNVDYIYSLNDIETDIANLRVILNEIKGADNHEEFVDLVSSTNDIYNLVQSIKSELPSKSDFNTMAEDLESISSRTNKLLLTSDESYKFIQDNLNDFKLVIDDLDERTKNFSRESGIERIDSKLNAINNMIVSGSKTNQVFNQIFEYLAEWVDNASVQINDISTRVESLNEIGQIKGMLEDMKADNSDNSESEELINALGIVFDKQTKRIASIETKLDRMIVENTVRDNSIDLSPMENTLNKFLVAMEEKFAAQQNKVNLLEARLEEMIKLVDTKETSQLTKKVGGMDKQIAKLNKSIEKIASHVIEK